MQISRTVSKHSLYRTTKRNSVFIFFSRDVTDDFYVIFQLLRHVYYEKCSVDVLFLSSGPFRGDFRKFLLEEHAVRNDRYKTSQWRHRKDARTYYAVRCSLTTEMLPRPCSGFGGVCVGLDFIYLVLFLSCHARYNLANARGVSGVVIL